MALTVGTALTYEPSAVANHALIGLDSGRALISYFRSTSGYARVLTATPPTLTAGPTTTLARNEDTRPALAKLDSGRVLHLYNTGFDSTHAQVLSVSGTTVTAGSAVSVGNSGALAAVTLDASRVLLGRTNTGPAGIKARMATVTGTTITLGPDNDVGSGDLVTMGAAFLDASRVLVAYGRGGTLYVAVWSISGDTVTAGTEVAVDSQDGMANVFAFDSTIGGVVYRDDFNNISFAPLLVSGTTVTAGPITHLPDGNDTFGGNWYSAAGVALSSTKAAIAYSNRPFSPIEIKFVELTRSGTTVTVPAAETVIVAEDFASRYVTAAALSPTRAIVAWAPDFLFEGRAALLYSGVPPLRLGQRDDDLPTTGPRLRVGASSRQRSIRVGWGSYW